MESTLALALTGFLVGLSVGMTGVGSGSLMTPALIILFRVHPAVAVGTDLAFAALTRAIGTGAQTGGPVADRRIARLMLCSSLPAAALTLVWLRFGGLESAQIDLIVRQAIVAALVLTLVAILARDRLIAWRRSLRLAWSPRILDTTTLGAAAVIGALSALSSIGAGALGCLAIALLHPRLDARAVAATGVATAVPLTAIAAAGHALIGHLDPTLLVQLLLGSVPGILLGARLAARLPTRQAREKRPT